MPARLETRQCTVALTKALPTAHAIAIVKKYKACRRRITMDSFMGSKLYDLCYGEEEEYATAASSTGIDFMYDPSMSESHASSSAGDSAVIGYDFNEDSNSIHGVESLGHIFQDVQIADTKVASVPSPKTPRRHMPRTAAAPIKLVTPTTTKIAKTKSDKIIDNDFTVTKEGNVLFTPEFSSRVKVPVTKFVVVDSMKLLEPFVIRGTYEGADGGDTGYHEEAFVLKVPPNDPTWRDQIRVDATSAIPEIKALLGPGESSPKQGNRTETMIQYGYTGPSPSSLGLYVGNLGHNMDKSVKNLTPLRVNRGILALFADNLPITFPTENLALKGDGPHHKRLLTRLRGLGASLKEQHDNLNNQGYNERITARLMLVWDCAQSVAAVAGAEKPIKLAMDDLHCAVVAAMDECTGFHLDLKNASSFVSCVPDFHMCFTNNPKVAFAHIFINTEKNEAFIVLVLQSFGTSTHFYGADNYHGALVASSLITFLRCHGVSGSYVGTSNHEWETGGDDAHLIEGEDRIWSTYVNKKCMFRMEQLLDFYKVHEQVPLVFSRLTGSRIIVHQSGSCIPERDLGGGDYQVGTDRIPFPAKRDPATVASFDIITYSEYKTLTEVFNN